MAILRKLVLISLVTLISASLLGCTIFGGGRERPSHFETRISESGLKHFELRYGARRNDEGSTSSRPPGASQGGAQQRSRPQKNPKRQHKRELKNMTKAAEELIEENKYCRDGFWVLEFDADTRGNFLRGECYDLATEQDRVQYPDTIKQW